LTPELYQYNSNLSLEGLQRPFGVGYRVHLFRPLWLVAVWHNKGLRGMTTDIYFSFSSQFNTFRCTVPVLLHFHKYSPTAMMSFTRKHLVCSCYYSKYIYFWNKGKYIVIFCLPLCLGCGIRQIVEASYTELKFVALYSFWLRGVKYRNIDLWAHL